MESQRANAARRSLSKDLKRMTLLNLGRGADLAEVQFRRVGTLQ